MRLLPMLGYAIVVACALVLAEARTGSAGNPLPAIQQIPEGNANNHDPAGDAANLWICDESHVCDGPGSALSRSFAPSSRFPYK